MKKTAAQLEAEYKKAEARAQALKEKAKKASAAEEAKKKAQLLQLVMEWAALNNGGKAKSLDAVIEMFQHFIEKKKAETRKGG